MNIRILTIIMIIIMVLCQIVLADNTNNENTFSSISNMYFKYVKEKDFNNASKLFHYPPNYSESQMKKDITAVMKTLNCLNEEFGEILSYTLDENKTKVIGLYFFGGDETYWKNNPRYDEIIYSVQFKEAGKGLISIKFCNLVNQVQIRQVCYGFSNLTPDLNQILTKAYKKMQEIYNESQ